VESNRRRIVVTGLGMVSSIGNSVEDSWEALIRGDYCAISHLAKTAKPHPSTGSPFD